MNVQENWRGDLKKISEEVPNARLCIRHVVTMLKKKQAKYIPFFRRLINNFKSKKIHKQYQDNLQVQINELAEKMNAHITQEKGQKMDKKDAEDENNHSQHVDVITNVNNTENKGVCTETFSGHDGTKCTGNKWTHNNGITIIMTNNFINPSITIKHHEEDTIENTDNIHCLYSKIAQVIVSTIPKINMNDVKDISKLLEKHIAKTNNSHTCRMFNVVTPQMPTWALKGYLESDYWNKTTKIVGNLIEKMAYYIVLEKGQILPSDIDEFCAELIKRGKCKDTIPRNPPKNSIPQTQEMRIKTQLEQKRSYVQNPQQPNHCLKNNQIVTNDRKLNGTDSDKELNSVKSKISQKASYNQKRVVDEAIDKSIKTLVYLKEVSDQLFLPNKNDNSILETSDMSVNTSTSKLITNNLDNNISQIHMTERKDEQTNKDCSINKSLMEQNLVKTATKIEQDTSEKVLTIHYAEVSEVRMPSLIMHSEPPIIKNHSKQLPISNSKSKAKGVPSVIRNEATDSKYKQSSDKLTTIKGRRGSAVKCNDPCPLIAAGCEDKFTAANECKKRTISIENTPRRRGSTNYIQPINTINQTTNKQNVKPFSIVNNLKPIIKYNKNLPQQSNEHALKSKIISQSRINQYSNFPQLSNESSNPLTKTKAKSQSEDNVKDLNESLNVTVTHNKLNENIKCDKDSTKKYLTYTKYDLKQVFSKVNVNNYKPTIPPTAGNAPESKELSNQNNVKVEKSISHDHSQLTTQCSKLNIEKNIETSNIKAKTEEIPYLRSSKTYAVFKPFRRHPLSTIEGTKNNEPNTEKKVDTKSSNDVYETSPSRCHSCKANSKCHTRLSKIPVTIQINSNQRPI